MGRIYNFAAGPSTLPLPVLEEVSEKLVDYEKSGMSLIEMSHRSKTYDAVHTETVDRARELLEIPDDFHILLLQGGATLQFGMIPLAFLREGATADYIITGSWSKKAFDDAERVGKINVPWNGKTENYMRIPDERELQFSDTAAYVHLCSNETIGGIQWQTYPDTGGIPLIMDASSDIMSRPIPWDRVSMVYAGTQKNLAPSGMAFIVMSSALVEAARKDLPAYLRYDLHVDKGSLYNTPPTFIVWVTNLTLRWIADNGGMRGIEKLRDEKAGMLYDILDTSSDFYRSPVDATCRSKMNVVWRLPDEDLEKRFINEAEQEGLSGLKGHRSVGGCRASIYNAMPVEGVKALADFMKVFMEKNG
jgi:phosphoserine aminotransferase